MHLKKTGTAVLALLASASAMGYEFEWGEFSGKTKSIITIGAAIRADSIDERLLGKLNVPGQQNLCPDGCLSFTGDPAPNQRLVNAKGGYFAAVKDDGDMNFKQWQPTAGGVKLSQELTVSWNDWTLKAGVLAFYDHINFAKDLHHFDTTFQPGVERQTLNVRQKVGRDFQLKDLFVNTKFQVFEHDFSSNIGWQHIRWGESTFLALNAVSQINPPNARLLRQPGTPISDIFRPTPAITLNTQLNDEMSVDFVYELGWVPVLIDPRGSFNSFVDIADGKSVTLGLSQFHEDPNGLQRLPAPANIISDSSARGSVLDERSGHPSHLGQGGAKLTWYLPDFNGGTEMGFYALHYHSQLPYISAVASKRSCLRDSTSIGQAFADCNGFKINQAQGLEPLPLDTIAEFLDYPENNVMLGVSFNTNLGKWSLAGEYSLRPNMPLQIHVPDVVYAAAKNALPKQQIDINLVTAASLIQAIQNPGSLPGVVLNPQRVLAFATYLAQNPLATTMIPADRTIFPNYIEGYKGLNVQPGEVIHGYARFPVDQLDITAIRALGSSDNPFGADQVIILTEVGMTHVWGLPNRQRLQLEGGDNNNSHASPGADGSGSGGVPDARRFNPHQQVAGFGSGFSGGYRVLVRFEYNNLLFGLNFKPSVYWGHDVFGIAPQPIQNFVAGTKNYALATEIEAGGAWSGTFAYQGSTGGGTVNTQRDRDVLAFSVAYTF